MDIGLLHVILGLGGALAAVCAFFVDDHRAKIGLWALSSAFWAANSIVYVLQPCL